MVRRFIVRALAFVLATSVLAGATELEAQTTRERFLFLIPAPGEGMSPEYVVELADETRKRLLTKLRHRLTILTTDVICDLLTESAFDCDVILNAQDAERLARAMQADAYLMGSVWFNSAAPYGRFRMVDIGRSGISGWMDVRGTPGDPPRRFAETVVDSLLNQVRAGELARECAQQRDEGDFEEALRRADRVFEVYPNHPSASECAAVVLEAMGQPADSQIPYYERAVLGDSLWDRAWQRLGRLHQTAGDSIAALEAFRRQLYITPNDRQRWRGVVAGYMTIGEYAKARDLVDEWLERNGGDVQFLQLKTRACFDGALWDCAVEGLAEQYTRDSALVGDTIYYQRIIAAAQAAENEDALLQWTAEAAAQVPDNASFWRAHADALSRAGMGDSAITALERALFSDPTDVATAVVLARRLIESTTIDTVTPLDTAALLMAGEYLDLVVSQSQDTAVLMNAAVLYFTPAQQLVQQQIQPAMPIAVSFLEKALEADVMGRLTEQGNFFMALGIFFQIFPLDQRVVESKDCILVEQEADMVRRGLEAMRIGAAISQQYARQVLQQLASFDQRIPTLREAFACNP